MAFSKNHPIAFKNTEEISNWLVKNFNDYHDTKLFLKKEVYPEEDMKELARKVHLYREEHNFCFYFDSLKKLLTLKDKEEDLKIFIEDYHNCKQNEKLFIQWHNETLCCLSTEVEGFFVTSIVYENKKPIGVKPFECQTYIDNPYVLPVIGFESFIELRSILQLK